MIVDDVLSEVKRLDKIREYEIVKPYLDELKKTFEKYRDKWNRYGNEYESARYESYDRCIDEIDDMLDRLKGGAE